MIVLIEEIGEAGLEVERELSETWLSQVLSDEESATGYKPVAGATLHARLEKVSEKVLLRARARLSISGECRRCLGPARAELPIEFTLSFVRKAPVLEESSEGEAEPHRDLEGSEASFALESVEEEVFDGRQIDLGAVVREQILLALPMALRCREGCKGLCTGGGPERNERDCGCERAGPDPRWAALRAIKLS